MDADDRLCCPVCLNDVVYSEDWDDWYCPECDWPLGLGATVICRPAAARVAGEAPDG